MIELVKLLKGEGGVTSIEYGLIAILIAVVIIVGVTAVGNEVLRLFTMISNSLIAIL